jgi:FixJ family two-component response regulator
VATADSLIAIVDDEAPVRRALLRLLRSAGLPGVAYASADEFLAALPQLHCRCVVVDVHMPGISGIELQLRLADLWPRLPVIVVTGQHSAQAEAQVRAHQPLAYLHKPLDADQLLGAIRSTAP